VALDAAEEETIEALKKWWDENGVQLLVIVVAVVGSYGAVTLWQNASNNSAASASDLYEEILSLALKEPGVVVTEDESTQIASAADALKADYPSSVYSLYGALFAAQQAVQANDLDEAEQELQWLLDNQQSGFFNQTEEGLILTANLRLGRVILAKGEADRALELINGIAPQSFESGYSELRGDIYMALGRLGDAHEAYTAAQQAGTGSQTLQMKLDDLPSQGL
jgi:predicted negative regulator of RcsB-dependent stress response